MNKAQLEEALAIIVTEKVKEAGGVCKFERKFGINRSTIQHFIKKESLPSSQTLEILTKVMSIPDEVLALLRIYAKESDRKARHSRTKKTSPSTVQSNKKAVPSRSDQVSAENLKPAYLSVDDSVVSQVSQFAMKAIDWLKVIGILPVVENSEARVRFLLTSRSFRQIEGNLSEAELEDTCKLIEELRRRWAIIVELSDEKRELAVRTLTHEVNALYLTMRAAREKLPMAAVEMLERQAEAWDIIKSGKKG